MGKMEERDFFFGLCLLFKIIETPVSRHTRGDTVGRGGTLLSSLPRGSYLYS